MAQASTHSANSMVARTPIVCIAAAANGPMKPNRNSASDIAREIVTRGQPNAFSSGTSKTPRVALTPADATRARNTTPTTTQP